ncbi:preprotein translocase subunit SecE [Thermosulfurimonas dismutans]|uniref:Protein translocase subunit SecE n=1 Tax=Thermosulfurimonas dismutans TaxID=999894 RepID=A0A179D2N7_9BACT|nr:preprotein translocase subunit SecE [Thermosulfurimonas dismutans]OAQ19979.1 Preprotein translocase subunit SecE [Thermosulfurimonas dismutans]
MPKVSRAKKRKVSGERVTYLKDIKRQGLVSNSLQFLKEVKVEFKKITWPSRKQTMATTAAVLSFTLFIAFYLGLVDLILSKIVQWLVY